MAPVYVDGEKTVTLKGERIAEEFQAIVEDYVQRRYGAEGREATGGGQGARGEKPFPVRVVGP